MEGISPSETPLSTQTIWHRIPKLTSFNNHKHFFKGSKVLRIWCRGLWRRVVLYKDTYFSGEKFLFLFYPENGRNKSVRNAGKYLHRRYGIASQNWHTSLTIDFFKGSRLWRIQCFGLWRRVVCYKHWFFFRRKILIPNFILKMEGINPSETPVSIYTDDMTSQPKLGIL